MYIWDALYGKIEFSPLVYKCMLSPEVQRLREVRLCNINSLCITGSSNTNDRRSLSMLDDFGDSGCQ